MPKERKKSRFFDKIKAASEGLVSPEIVSVDAASEGLVSPEIVSVDRFKQLEDQILVTVEFVNNTIVPMIGYLQTGLNALVLELQKYDPELCKSWVKKNVPPVPDMNQSEGNKQ